MRPQRTGAVRGATRRRGALRRAALVAVIGVVGSGVVSAQEALTPATVAATLEDVAPQFAATRTAAERAEIEYQLTLDGQRPSLSLDVTPWAFDRRTIATGVPAGIAGAPSSIDSVTNSVGATFSVEQPLPTSGVVSGAVGADISLLGGDAESLEVAPVLSATWSQPLLVNGELLGDSILRATLRSAAIARERVAASNRLQRNGAVQGAMAQWVQVGALRRTVATLEATRALLQAQLANAELDRESGLVSENTVLALQVSVNGTSAGVFDAQLALTEAELNLARSLGISPAEIVIPDEFVVPALPSDLDAVTDPSMNPVPEGLVAGSPAVAIQDLTIDQVAQGVLLRGIEDRPFLVVTGRVAPQYAPDRAESRNPVDAIADLIADGASLDTTLAVNLSIPLRTDRERAARARIDELAAEDAARARATTLSEERRRLETLLVSRGFIIQRLELVEVDARFQRQRLANQRVLAEGGVATDLSVQEIELELRRRADERWSLRAELLLNALQIHATVGNDLVAVLSGD